LNTKGSFGNIDNFASHSVVENRKAKAFLSILGNNLNSKLKKQTEDVSGGIKKSSTIEAEKIRKMSVAE
jgi:hypothetical protein